MSLLLYALVAAAVDQPPVRDWAETLRRDAIALHDDIAANHPGPHNPDDPDFSARNDAQLKRALQRASTAKSYADYFYAMRQYVASFDDGHLQYGVYGATPEDYRWPGFITRFELDGEQRVFAREDWAPVPVGARLVGCDGRPADALAAEIVGSIVGRWNLMSQRLRWGDYLFTNTSNPYVVHPSVCTFEVNGEEKTVDLHRRPTDWKAINALKSGAAPSATAPVTGMQTLADGTRWIRMTSFNGDPASEAGKALTAVLVQLAAEQEAARSRPIVLDLRGNGGGSSDWSLQIARLIWGQGAVDALPPDRATVIWRASEANLKSLQDDYATHGKDGGLSPETKKWFETSIAGLKSALETGRAVWQPSDDETPAAASQASVGREPIGPVFVLTDSRCASACLDAVDLWRALGATHVGQETSADTLYMDTRSAELPSGLGKISVPRKVYRGRPRKSNETVTPQHRFSGDSSDTPALETWIAGLHAR